MRKFIIIPFGAFLLWGLAMADENPVQMKGTNIRGTTELPKVLYIVPWKKAGIGDLSIQAGLDAIDDELAPLDRDIFRRQVEYYEMLHSKEGAKRPK
jgi:hypothetical protein